MHNETQRAEKARLDNRWVYPFDHAFHSFNPTTRLNAYPRPSVAIGLIVRSNSKALQMTSIPPQQHLANIRNSLPDWPDDLREHWLSPEADRKGWPPHQGSDWRYAIGPERDLAYLQRLSWTRVSQEITPDLFAVQSRDLLVGMFRGYYYRDPSESAFAYFDGGRERFEGLTRFILESGRFPWSPALELRSDGLVILDGFHRILALLYLSGFFSTRDDDPVPTFHRYSFDYWIANIT